MFKAFINKGKIWEREHLVGETDTSVSDLCFDLLWDI